MVPGPNGLLAPPNPGVIRGDGSVTGSKSEAAEALMQYWKQLGSEVAWEEDELQHTADEISHILKPIIANASSVVGRKPGIVDMRAALVSIKGTHGIHGWTKNDLKLIAGSPAALAL